MYRWGGLSTYSRQAKRREADSYGTWVQGRRSKPELIAGHPVGTLVAERAA
jgi:hypothetical protein